MPGHIYLHNTKTWHCASQRTGLQQIQYCLVIWKKCFNTRFSFIYSCVENRFIKLSQDVESVEVNGKQKMDPWQKGNCKVFLLGWKRGQKLRNGRNNKTLERLQGKIHMFCIKRLYCQLQNLFNI